MPDFVHMHHPEVDACAEAPKEAFDAVWSDLGWTEVEPHETDSLAETDQPQATDSDTADSNKPPKE